MREKREQSTENREQRKATGFDNTSSERSRESVMLEQSEASKNARLFTPNNNHCKSNFKKKPALCEQQLLLAANKDKDEDSFLLRLAKLYAWKRRGSVAKRCGLTKYLRL